MRQPRIVLLCLAALLAGADLAAALNFGLFQHGGRAMGQVGALTARADEPSAVTYNPAAIAHLEGLQAQAGLDFNNADDEYKSSSGSFSAHHIIQFPASLYATWKGESPWAVGIGLDSPFYYRTDWRPVFFPGRFLERVFEVRVYEVHPVLAYDLGDGWSVGGGVRYLFGTMEQGDNARVDLFTAPGQPLTRVEVERTAEADVDAFTWDLAVHYAATSWGWGAVYRGNAELKGSGDVDYNPRDVPAGNPALDAALRSRFGNGGSASQSFELPREIRGGIWYAPYPELRLELDASWQSWSSLENTDITYSPNAVGDGPTVTTSRDWDDTLSLRLGLEGDITDNFMLYGGFAMEPSPVPGDTLEPGFPRGDALVYAIGASYSFPRISFDVGYSLHQHDDFSGQNQELLNPTVRGSYSTNNPTFGFSVRWRP
ncbi:MAG TPA: outer membrane protein transport protein [Thermoanaerobaculia bacterium]|nr:outer membrane protein transport protein [Thermoanaerobaculia bacterium]